MYKSGGVIRFVYFCKEQNSHYNMGKIEEVIGHASEKVSSKKEPVTFTYWGLQRYGVEAYGPVIYNLTDGYNAIFGEPTTIVDAFESGIGNGYFASRIIVYKEKQTIVIIDRIKQCIIPFDAMSAYHPLDLTTQNFSGGGLEKVTSSNPTIGTVGNKLLTLNLRQTQYVEKPINVHTDVCYGFEITTNDMANPTIDIWLGDDANALSKLSGIMDIIFSAPNRKLSDDAKIETEEIEILDVLCLLYPDEFKVTIEEQLAKDAAKAKQQKENTATSNNSGCMVAIIFMIISSICAYIL